jgi:acetamidase/formamidase
MPVVNGVAAFVNLAEHEVYNGKSTEAYSIVVTLDEGDAEKLKSEGIKVREYKNQPQRKFKTKFEDFPVIDNEGEPVARASVRYGDKVRIKYSAGDPHPVHGVTPYLQAVRVVEKGEVSVNDDDGEF